MAQVLFGIVEAVNVIYAKPRNVPFLYQPEDQFVNSGEDYGQLDADRGQFVDVEEATVIDLVGRHAPEAQAIRLFGQQFLQAVEAARVSADAVERLDGPFERAAHLAALGDERGQPA